MMALVRLSPVTGGLAAFKAFLKSEYSEENLDFWVSCEDYKKIKSPSKLPPRAQKIYNEFISVQAAKEVGLCGSLQVQSGRGLRLRESTGETWPWRRSL